MSRWINADAFLTEISSDVMGGLNYKFYIRTAPSIDLVRCVECKKAHLTYDGECKYCDEWKDDDGNYIEVYHDGNHYCSYGERKESK